MNFHWYLSYSKSPWVSRTFFNIPADLNALVFMVSTCSLILAPEPSALITVVISVTFMFHSFFPFSSRSRYLSLFFFLFFFCCFLSFWLCGQLERQSSLFGRFSFFFFFFFWLLSRGLVVWPRQDDPFVSQNPRKFCASHFLGWIPGCALTICSYGQI